MAKSYEQKLKSHINVCGNTARVYILHGAARIAKDFAVAAAKSAFKLHPELREAASVIGYASSETAYGRTVSYPFAIKVY